MSKIPKILIPTLLLAFLGVIFFSQTSLADFDKTSIITVTVEETGRSDTEVNYDVTIALKKEPSVLTCSNPDDPSLRILYKLVPLDTNTSIKKPDKKNLYVAGDGKPPYEGEWTQNNNSERVHNDNTLKVSVGRGTGFFYVQLFCWNLSGRNEYINMFEHSIEGVSIEENVEDPASLENSLQFPLSGVDVKDQDNDGLQDGVEKSNECPHEKIPDSDGDGIKDGLDGDPCNNPALVSGRRVIYNTEAECEIAVAELTRGDLEVPWVCLTLKGIDHDYYSPVKPSGGSIYGSLFSSPGVLDTSGWDPDLTPFRNLIGTYYNVAISFGALAAIIMIIVGGYQYATAAGNQARITEAKTTINYALLGLAVVILTAVFFNLINPAILAGG